MLKKIVTAEALDGHRTKIIAVGMLLAALGQIGKYVVDILEKGASEIDLSLALTQLGAAFGLLTAAAHKTT